MSRRRVLSALLAGAAAPAGAARADEPFEIADLSIDADRALGRRCRVVAPRGVRAAELPVLVLLHGLGETKSERAGSDAWLSPYGARRALDRLKSPPIARELPREKILSDAEIEALNGSLSERPYAGLVLVCPYMPNPYSFPGGPSKMFPRYARLLTEALLPAVRERFGNAGRTREATGLAGVSLGGYTALEVGLRAPEAFATVGTVQGAFGPEQALTYARRFGELGPAAPRGVYVATSSYDPYRAANERFGRKLAERGVPTRLSVRRGPHSQGFLREVGSIDLLVWHDRALRGGVETGETRPG